MPALPPSPGSNPPAWPHCNGNGAPHSSASIQLPLDAILNGLPLELRPRLRRNEAGGQTVSIPLETILPQLARGVVRTSFGALRQAAPHLFSTETGHDEVQVTLPLGEILSRLNPAFILRRRSQRQVEVPEDVSSPFDLQGQALAASPGPSPPEPRADPLPLIAPTSPRRPPGLLSCVPPRPHSVIAMPSSCRPPGEPFILSLLSLADEWPEAVRREILELNLVEATVALPAQALEQALRQGRVAFAWKTLRSWVTPAPLPTVSAQDDTAVELPLRIVAPLFLARQPQTRQPRQKAALDQTIPDLFFGFPAPEPPGIAPAPGAARDSNFSVRDAGPDSIPAPPTEAKQGAPPGIGFVAKYATPKEIVSRAAALDNVAGALIGLPEGLLVASRLGADLNADTLAAFLPQIFGKVSQCAKELRMGELNKLSFTVGNIPWELFRVNAIFFAAFGRPGQPMPGSQLAALARELDHKPK
jgi:predicted regulator of Ras-like GTPase activity (Roadblock/LC7/MglB family)